MSSDYTNKELLEAIYDVRDRVTRIEEGFKRTDKLEAKAEEGYAKALEAKDIAEDALALGSSNREQINSIKANNKWAWGFVITSIGAVVAQYFGIAK